MEQLEFSYIAVRMQSHATVLNSLDIFYKVKDIFMHACVFSCVLTLLQPHRLQPTKSLHPWVFSRQEYWSGLPFCSPGDLPNPGIEPTSPTLAGGFFATELPGKPKDTSI